MQLIRQSIDHAHHHVPEIALKVSRQMLAKRRWRARAQDGTDFGFELDAPLKHADLIFQNSKAAYVIDQEPERVLLVRFGTCKEAATVAWQIGNLHFPIAVMDGGLLVEDDLAIRQMLERQQIPFTEVQEVFQPLRAARSHQHHAHPHAESEHLTHAH
jgi:urease accessory protein